MMCDPHIRLGLGVLYVPFSKAVTPEEARVAIFTINVGEK
jgi:hypothetical protein